MSIKLRLGTPEIRGSGVGRSSSGRAHSFKGLEYLIDPAWQMHLQFELFSILTSPLKAVVCAVPSVGKVHIKDVLLLIRTSSLCGDSGFPPEKYVTMTICLTSNS